MRLPVAGMRGRLLSLVLLNVLALAVVGGVVYASFDRVQELARAMARDELARIVANATLERGLAAVNARIALLARSCRGASFDSDWVEFVAGFDEIERLDVDSGVAAEIRRLRPAAGEMISSCQRIRGALIRLQRLDERLLLELGALDTITARALVEQTLARRDLSHLDQIMLLISGFRETALLVGKQIASHVNGGDDPARLGALDMLEDLELRLQSFVAATPEMSNARARIAVVTRLLRFQAADLFEALARFDSAVSQTLATKAQIALLTTRLDQLSQQRTQALDADLERAIDGALRRLGLAAAAIVLLSLLLTGWIIRSGIQRPLTAILHQVDAIARGVPETRPMATRDDEWGQIQAALSQMRDDLARAVKTAQDASAAKSQFLAVMSHELRTPMNGIIGLAEILSAEDLDPARRRDYARTIAASGEALLKILNDILDLSKVEAGRLALDPASFCPATTLDEVRALFADMAGERNILLETAWQGPRRCYRADAGRIRQMLSNLVSNALKFTPAGSIRVVAREVEAGGAGDALLEFSVVDTGPGMTPKEVEILFLPFTRLDNHATRQTGGTGLGLSIVRMLAEQMGGNTGVESTPRRGRAFLVHAAGDAADHRRAARRAGETGRPRRTGATDGARAHRRGRRGQSAGHRSLPAAARSRLRERRGRARGGDAARGIGWDRPRADGLQHARARRVRGDARDPCPGRADRPAPRTDRGDDRARLHRGSRPMPGGRDGRFPRQAPQARRCGRSPRPPLRAGAAVRPA